MTYQYSPILLPVHHFPQHQTDECLAACAAMVLAYIGTPKPYNRLLKVLNIRDFGTSFFNLRSLTQLGVMVGIAEGNLDRLYTELSRNHPCIVPVQTAELPHWNKVRSEHAVVVVGIDSRSVYLNDPELPDAPVEVPLGDFDLAWLERDEFYAVLTA